MGKPLDQIIVIDLEATCWEGDPPPDQEREIIEIGLCLLDVRTGRRGEHTSIVVRPERSTVSAYCTELTTLTQEEVEGGISFAEACRLLRDTYRSRQGVWASFGDYDRQQFERQCRSQQVVYPFGPRHINVKTLASLIHRIGLACSTACLHASTLRTSPTVGLKPAQLSLGDVREVLVVSCAGGAVRGRAPEL